MYLIKITTKSVPAEFKGLVNEMTLNIEAKTLVEAENKLGIIKRNIKRENTTEIQLIEKKTDKVLESCKFYTL